MSVPSWISSMIFVQTLMFVPLFLGFYIVFENTDIEYVGIYLSLFSSCVIFILNMIFFICMAKRRLKQQEQDQLETLIKQSNRAVNILSPYPSEIVYRPSEQFNV